jgi:hypothetical protein
MRFTVLHEATQTSVMATSLLYQLPRSVMRNPLTVIPRSAVCKCFQTTYAHKSELGAIFRLVSLISRTELNTVSNTCLQCSSIIRHGNNFQTCDGGRREKNTGCKLQKYVLFSKNYQRESNTASSLIFSH